MTSPVSLSSQVSLRCRSSPRSRSSFPHEVPHSGAALCSAGSRGSVPPRHRSYCGTPTPCPTAPLTFACAAVPPHRRRAQGLPSSSAFLAMHAQVFDPGRATRQTSGDEPLPFASMVMPSAPSRTSASATSPFRDSIPRPACSLSTLRGHGYPSDAYGHARLASGWWSSLAGREFNPLKRCSRFRSGVWLHMAFSWSRLAWRTEGPGMGAVRKRASQASGPDFRRRGQIHPSPSSWIPVPRPLDATSCPKFIAQSAIAPTQCERWDQTRARCGGRCQKRAFRHPPSHPRH